tara:strand:- start:308 stop:631 length:324 start_codon:yes stop_codon:yes gene_type:complete
MRLMNDPNNLPKSISHKKLSHLLSTAPKDKFSINDSNDHENTLEEKKVYEAAENWEKSTRTLVTQISEIKNKNLINKSPNSLIALGAMEAHLNMAMQALNVFKNDKN